MAEKAIRASKIIALLEEGCSQCYVSQRLNVSRSTVQRTWTRYQETGSVQRRQGSGRKRCTQPRDDRFLVTQALRNRKCSYIDLKRNLEEVRGAQVSLWTVRRLLDADIRSRRPARAPIARLRFARNCLSWTLGNWSSVLFSDEARICLHGEDRRRRVLRRPGERYADVCFEEITPYGGGSVMFWAGVTSNYRTEIVFIENGSLNAQRYITEILSQNAQPALTVIGEDAIYMDDNARAHRSSDVDTQRTHTTAKLQPLDVGLNAPFKSFYNAAVDSWLLRNPGQMLTIYHVAECVGQAYLKAMTPINITNAFRKCGIHPFDDSIFTDVVFLPSSVTDRPDPELTISEPTEAQVSRACASPSLLEMTQDNSEIISSLFDAQEKTPNHDVNCSVIDTAPQKPLYVPSIATSDIAAQPQKYDNQLDIPSTSRGHGTFISPSMFRPPIKAGPRKIRKRRKLGKSMIATDTPEKNEIENKKKTCIKNVKKRRKKKQLQSIAIVLVRPMKRFS